MTRYRVLPYRQGSRSAKALANALGGKVLRLEGSRYNPRQGDIIINWGNTNANDNCLNDGASVRRVSNKLAFFQKMKGNDWLPQFWEKEEDIPDDAFPVVCRTVLAGHSGEGIVIANTREELVPCQLYVKYIKKKDEYRIHLGKRYFAEDNEEKIYETVTIAVQRKAKREGFEEANFQVRNHQNGFVYVRGGVVPPVTVLGAARSCFEKSGLDFGAVDVIYNQAQEKAYVLEINTAPGLEGQTVEDYANFFKGLND